MRDEFPARIKDALARQVGMRCGNPNCRKPTIGPGINIGVAAHVTAASRGGPRYDNELSPDARRDISNGIWLCQNCAKLIDGDEDRYSIETLVEWRRLSEQAARLDIEASAPSLERGYADDVDKERLRTHRTLFRILGILEQEIETVQTWADRTKTNDELAELSIGFPATGVIRRLRGGLATLKDLRISRRWLLSWKVDYLVYAMSHKGSALLTALERYGSEQVDWELKRGHLLAATSISSLLTEYSSMCSDEAAELEDRAGTPTDEEARAFAKVIGDMGRAESKKFSEGWPDAFHRVREANRLLNRRNADGFKYTLLCESLLDATKEFKFKTADQRVWFLERLYDECLGWYFHLWNDHRDDARVEAQEHRLKRLLEMQSSREVVDAFTDMTCSIRLTAEQTKPVSRSEYESHEACEEARLEVLRPSAVAYGRFQELAESHLAGVQSPIDPA